MDRLVDIELSWKQGSPMMLKHVDGSKHGASNNISTAEEPLNKVNLKATVVVGFHDNTHMQNIYKETHIVFRSTGKDLNIDIYFETLMISGSHHSLLGSKTVFIFKKSNSKSGEVDSNKTSCINLSNKKHFRAM